MAADMKKTTEHKGRMVSSFSSSQLNLLDQYWTSTGPELDWNWTIPPSIHRCFLSEQLRSRTWMETKGSGVPQLIQDQQDVLGPL